MIACETEELLLLVTVDMIQYDNSDDIFLNSLAALSDTAFIGRRERCGYIIDKQTDEIKFQTLWCLGVVGECHSAHLSEHCCGWVGSIYPEPALRP